MKWKVLQSRYLEKDPPWFQVRVDKVELPSGEVLDNYYVLEYPDWVGIIAITKDQKLVMIRQYRHAIEEVILEIPAGVVDHDESNNLNAAKRELLEETGYGNGEWDLLMKTSANPGTHSNDCFIYIARDVELLQDQNLDRTEDIEVELYDFVEIKEKLDNDEIVQSMHSAPLYKFLFSESLK